MYSIYEIKSGDTLDSIAIMFNTTKDELENINSDLNGNYIIVPNNRNNMFDMYTVKNGDNLYMIAQSYNITPDDLALINGIKKNDYIYPNQQLMVPNSSNLMYITKENDTIDILTDYFNTSYDNLAKQNKIYLLPDQLIIFKEEKF